MNITTIDRQILSKLNQPQKDSHKGENGRLMIIGGSKLFHGASLFALTVASRIVDMTYYASVTENLELTKQLKSKLYSFIAVPQSAIGDYIDQADVVLIGPGMVRGSKQYTGTGETGEQTRTLVCNLLRQYPKKTWLLDAGALQALKVEDITTLESVILTPHQGEFERLFAISLAECSLEEQIDIVQAKAREVGAVVVLKGQQDIVVDGRSGSVKPLINQTGNEGMTKGGTGDVLAGLIAALACTNDLFMASAAGAYINGLAGDQLYTQVGPYFNADDLAAKVPQVLWSQLA